MSATGSTQTPYLEPRDGSEVASESTPLLFAGAGKSLQGHDHLPAADIDQDTSNIEPEQTQRSEKAWYRRPSPWWILGAMPLSSMAMSSTMAPRVQIYTRLACLALRPEYSVPSVQVYGIVHAASWEMASRSHGNVTSPAHYTDQEAFNFSLTVGDGVPSPSERCKTDPEVISATTRLITIMTTTLGVLTCITAGWWGQLSDRSGRTKVMLFATFGMLFGDFTFILVSWHSEVLPGGYFFLIASPIVDGLLGGLSTATTTMTAYIGDCADPLDRARTFSLASGLFFAGKAVGPWLGGRTINYTGDLLSVFYFAAVVHILAVVYWVLVVPESLPDLVRRTNLAAQKERLAKERLEGTSVIWRVSRLFEPLKILLPKRIEDGNMRRRWDWNLTLLSLAHSFSAITMASYPYTMTYAQQRFKWGAKELGTWLSMVSTAQATFLLAILPVFIKLFKPDPRSIRLGGREDDLLVRPATDALPGAPTPPRTIPVVPSIISSTAAHAPHFDLYLARGLLLLDLVLSLCTMLASTSPIFTAATSIAAFGGGLYPAFISLALHLGKSRENGKLFGAMSIPHTIASQVLGPAAYAMTMIATVDKFPQSIFLVSAVVMACAFVFTSLIRLPPPSDM